MGAQAFKLVWIALSKCSSFMGPIWSRQKMMTTMMLVADKAICSLAGFHLKMGPVSSRNLLRGSLSDPTCKPSDSDLRHQTSGNHAEGCLSGFCGWHRMI